MEWRESKKRRNENGDVSKISALETQMKEILEQNRKLQEMILTLSTKDARYVITSHQFLVETKIVCS